MNNIVREKSVEELRSAVEELPGILSTKNGPRDYLREVDLKNEIVRTIEHTEYNSPPTDRDELERYGTHMFLPLAHIEDDKQFAEKFTEIAKQHFLEYLRSRLSLRTQQFAGDKEMSGMYVDNVATALGEGTPEVALLIRIARFKAHHPEDAGVKGGYVFSNSELLINDVLRMPLGEAAEHLLGVRISDVSSDYYKEHGVRL